jgi:hypothetical protein
MSLVFDSIDPNLCCVADECSDREPPDQSKIWRGSGEEEITEEWG